MERLIVKSETIRSIGYDAKKSDLEVAFQDGTALLFMAVPATVYLDLMNAEDAEAFYAKKIKNEYVFRKLK